ncbi:MAG: hypothetical protein QOE05_772 [Actinomycetota bacterium]|jgi:uncharacterized protein (DUF58 family)|nr:hypothetical protein [Actinomycetota bacterium]
MKADPKALPPPPLVEASTARRLSLDVARRLDGLLQGDHLGYLPGPGTEPAESRHYSPGDDVRRMDWAVTARTQVPHVHTTTAERELETTVLVDLSGSMSFGTARAEKRDVALALAAAFLHLGSRPGDRVRATVLGADGIRALPPRGGRDGALLMLHTLLRQPRAMAGGPLLGQALAGLAAARHRRGLVVVVSDLLDPVETWSRPLRIIGTRHDVVVAQVVDRRELSLPSVGALRLVDPESGRQLEIATGAKVRARYAAAAAERLEQQRLGVRAAGAGHAVIRTDEDWLPQLARFLTTRRRTRTALRPAGAS